MSRLRPRCREGRRPRQQRGQPQVAPSQGVQPQRRLTTRILDAFGKAQILAARLNDGIALTTQSWTVALSLKPHFICNQIVSSLRPSGEDVPIVLSEPLARGLPFSVQLWGGASTDVDHALVAHGGEQVDEHPFMQLDLDGWSAQPDPGSLEVVRVADEATLAVQRSVGSEGFGGTPPIVAETFAPSAALARDDFAFFLGSLDGRPVATSTAVVVDDNTVGVFGVATLEAFRGRGAGTALTAAALTFGVERGAGVGWLQASKMGEPVYRGMGFAAVGTHRVFRHVSAP